MAKCEESFSAWEKGEPMNKLTSVYISSNISTDKMLEALNYMRDNAHANHAAKVAAEQARYEQELKDIELFRDMFYCSNYEK